MRQVTPPFREISETRSKLDKATDALEYGDILFLPSNLAEVLALLQSAHTAAEISILCPVGPTYEGQDVATCPTCRSHGFLDREDFDRCPEIHEPPAP